MLTECVCSSRQAAPAVYMQSIHEVLTCTVPARHCVPDSRDPHGKNLNRSANNEGPPLPDKLIIPLIIQLPSTTTPTSPTPKKTHMEVFNENKEDMISRASSAVGPEEPLAQLRLAPLLVYARSPPHISMTWRALDRRAGIKISYAMTAKTTYCTVLYHLPAAHKRCHQSPITNHSPGVDPPGG